ncbi:hypothetical protein VTN00DRAFT_8154 [Thermoascus crustaceus]|uniref:uncharacterized protein n=1 Tax=Thermoascus crustaceus TaxID=5088 RepID=UPI003743C9D8
MLIIPYTRNSWRVKGSILFIVTAWWVQSWAWYSVTGLIHPRCPFLGRRDIRQTSIIRVTPPQGWFLVQGTIIYTAGIKLFLHLNVQKQWPSEGSVVTCLVVCFTAVILIGEAFCRLVEYPSGALAYRLFDWIRE